MSLIDQAYDLPPVPTGAVPRRRDNDRPQPEVKDSNPKDSIGATKVPLSLVPTTAIALVSLAHLDGALKYGKWNWRIAGVRASIYVDAAKRHLDKWFHGEDIDPDSGLPHFAMAGACINILIDSMMSKTLVDDRPPRIDIGKVFNDLTPHVARLAAQHADKSPRHYTVADKVIPHDDPKHSQR